MSDTYFRFVRGRNVTLDDCKAQGALGKAMRFEGGKDAQRRWNEGISVYDDLDYSCTLAASSGFRVGSYIVALILPMGHALRSHRQAGTSTTTLFMQNASALLALVAEPPMRIPGS